MVMAPIGFFYDEYTGVEFKNYLIGTKNQAATDALRAVMKDGTEILMPPFGLIRPSNSRLFDVGILTFEPRTDRELVWFHTCFKPLLKPDAEIVYLGD
jgi:hypothetical protein